MKNPIREYKRERDLTVSELAVMTNLSPATIWKVLDGQTKTLNDKLVATFQQLGYDPDQLRKDYQDYREAKRKELVAG